VLELAEARVNCEQNSLLYLVWRTTGGACHTLLPSGSSRPGCFYRTIAEGMTLRHLTSLPGSRANALGKLRRAAGSTSLTKPSSRACRAPMGWLGELTAASARYDGLPASVMGALRDPGSTLHASCVGLRAAAGDLLAGAQRSGQIRADLDQDELLAAAYAMAWASRQAAWPGDAGERFLAILVEGLAARPSPG